MKDKTSPLWPLLIAALNSRNCSLYYSWSKKVISLQKTIITLFDTKFTWAHRCIFNFDFHNIARQLSPSRATNLTNACRLQTCRRFLLPLSTAFSYHCRERYEFRLAGVYTSVVCIGHTHTPLFSNRMTVILWHSSFLKANYSVANCRLSNFLTPKWSLMVELKAYTKRRLIIISWIE